MMHLDALPNQQPDERLILFLRRFWFEVVKIALLFALLLLVPIGFTVYFQDIVGGWFADSVFGPILTMITSLYFFAVWILFFYAFTDYYLDSWAVTNERIISIEQDGLFNRTASELHLASIQDVTSEVHGPLHTFFDFGDVYIQTAAERERFTFKNVRHPESLKEQILKLIESDKKRHGDLSQKKIEA